MSGAPPRRDPREAEAEERARAGGAGAV